jgi:translation elongation factor EF-Tu-like GTPase
MVSRLLIHAQPEGVEMAMPGDNLEVNVELIYPTAMNP